MSELHPFFGISRHPLERLLGSARASGSESQSSSVEHVHSDSEAAANRAKQMVGRNLETIVAQFSLRRAANSELSYRADDPKPGHVGSDEKRSHALDTLTTTLDERLRKGRNHAGAVAVADPDLLAVEPP